MRIAGVGRQSANEKFLEKIADRGAPDADKRVFESQLRSIAATRRIVEIGDATGSEASQDA